MRAVWSFWSVPFLARRSITWCTPLHHLLAWGLSLRLARQHYPETMLVTDRAGKKLLVEQLGLPFVHVSTDLEQLADVDPGWWALGKFIAYSLQDRPFVHVDTDVFLWKPLPIAVAQSPIFTQCPEFYANESKPSVRAIEQAFTQQNTQLPVEWKWARARGQRYFREENCGILGGTHVDFIRHYSRTGLDLALRPENRLAWSHLPDKFSHNFSVEQFFLAACLDFHHSHAASEFRGVTVGHLFSSVAEACDISRAARTGFTHLWGATKSHPAVGRRLEERMRREDPAYFRRCEKIAGP
jgi:hypothetical protein